MSFSPVPRSTTISLLRSLALVFSPSPLQLGLDYNDVGVLLAHSPLTALPDRNLILDYLPLLNEG